MSGALGPPISFAFLSLFFFFFLLFHCILGRGQMLFGGKHCQDCTVSFIKGRNENSIHVDRFERISVNTSGLSVRVAPLALSLWTEARSVRRCEKGEAHTVLVAVVQRGFSFMFSVGRFISFTYHVIDELAFSTSQSVFGHVYSGLNIKI